MSTKKRKFTIAFKPNKQEFAFVINAIYNKHINQIHADISFVKLYSEAYHMMIEQQGKNLYMKTVALMQSRIKEISKSIEEETQKDFFWEEFNRKWNGYKMAIQQIADILLRMDRYVQDHHKTPIRDRGLNLWRDHIVYSSKIQSQLQNTLAEVLHRERIGEVDKSLIKNIFMMLKDFGVGASVCKTLFQIRFLEVSADYYRGESQKLIECCDISDYLSNVENHLIEEIIRVSHYSDIISRKKIVKLMCKEMIGNHMLRLIHMENSGLATLHVKDRWIKKMIRVSHYSNIRWQKEIVNVTCKEMIGNYMLKLIRKENSWLATLFLDDRYEDLRNLYVIFSKYVPNGLVKLRNVVTLHVRNTGEQFVKDPERLKDPVVFVQELLDKKDKYDTIFNNDEDLRGALDSSFEYIVNLNDNLPEFVSLFLDVKLRRKGFEGVSEDIILDKVVMLIQLLHDKDLFHKYYINHLAKRLLFRKTVSKHTERTLTVKLKRVCGFKFVALETMVVDMKTSRKLLKGFYRSRIEPSDDPKLRVHVLTTCSWPLSRTIHSSCNLPIEVSSLYEKYKSYYLGIHTHKKLSLQANMGNAKIIATFGNGRKHELHVSTYQMCILMLFNDVDQLSYKEIEKATKINSLDLIKCLYSMALVKGKNIIKKEPMNGYIGEDDLFFFNDTFSSKSYKVKLGKMDIPRESESEKLQTRKSVEENRRPQIDAAIVRIMKSRKQLDHSNVITEVTKQLMSLFLPNPTDIKKRIESLIERDYLERDNIDNYLYRYLA